MNAVVTLTDLHVPVDVDAQIVGVPASCDLVIDADSVTINGNYALQPSPTDPHFLDVNLVGATPVVTLGNVNDDFVGGICSIPVIEQIVGLFLPDVRTLMQQNLTRLLGDADGAGPADSPVADAVEQALSQINIAGDIGTALGIRLDSNITAATEDPNGINLHATAAFSSLGVAPEAPDLTGSVGFPGEILGALPQTTPGGLGFDVGVGASASGFNQLLASETERGLLNVDVTSLNGQPLTLRSLFDLVGAGGLITQDRPVAITLRPEVAPIVTPAPGPGGATGELRFHGYRAVIKTADETNAVLLELVLDFRTGVGLVLTDAGLGFTFAQPAAEDLSATITKNTSTCPSRWSPGCSSSCRRRCSRRCRTRCPASRCRSSRAWTCRSWRSAGSGRASSSSPTWCPRPDDHDTSTGEGTAAPARRPRRRARGAAGTSAGAPPGLAVDLDGRPGRRRRRRGRRCARSRAAASGTTRPRRRLDARRRRGP